MLVLDMIYVDWIVKKKEKKIYKYFEMSFSCLGPFGVWVVTSLLGALVADYDGMRNWSA